MDGSIVGKRIKEFDYTEQTILAHKDWQKKFKEAISEVKSRSTEGYGWVKDNRNGLLFEDDTELSLLKNGLGAKMQEKLVHVGLTTLGIISLALADEIRAAQLVKDTKGLSKKKVTAWNTIFCQIPPVPGACPPNKDHHLAVNPHLSRYPTPIPNLEPDGEEE